MMKAGVLALAAAGCVWPQTGAHFEAVSVEPSTVDVRGVRQAAGGGPGTSDPGHVRLYGVNFTSLLMQAFDMQPDQLTNVKWTGPSSYDIEATLARGTSKDQYKEMLRNLLVERFGLRYHMETKDVEGFELRAGKVKMLPAAPASEAYDHAPSRGLLRQLDAHGAPELQPGRKGRSQFGLPTGGMRISARMQEAQDIALMCIAQLHVPVVDRTGLTGQYDFNLDFMPDPRASRGRGVTAPEVAVAPSDEATLRMPDFQAAVQEQLGLKLVRKKVPFQSLVVEEPLKAVGN